MLQIISKKFFKSDDPSTYYSTEEKALIYSNADTLEKIIITPLAQLEKIETNNGITTYLLRYVNHLEKQNTSGFNFVAMGQSEIINDLICCFTLWFGNIFITDKYYLQRLIRKARDGVADKDPPQKVLPSYFTTKMITEDSVRGFNEFINSLINLKRNEYKSIIKVIRQFYDAILLVNSNLNLSYTMFIATVEALAQKFDGFITEWEHCPENMVKRLNVTFDYLPEEISDEIKKVIIEETHSKLSRRYMDFALKHIKFDYFSVDAKDAINPIRKSMLKQLIKNSYILRSKYIHSLKELPDMIKLTGKSEFNGKDKNMQITFSGIARFCRYIILDVINGKDKVAKEEFNYFNDLPGTIFLPIAPQYWIYKPDTLIVENIISYFNHFIIYFLNVKLGIQEKIVDLREVCKK